MSPSFHLFDHAVPLDTLNEIRSRFAAAAAKHPPLPHAIVWCADVDPPLPDAIHQVLGGGSRPPIRCGVSKGNKLSYELFFADRPALGNYIELARLAAERLPTWNCEGFHPWTYTLYRMVSENPSRVSFGASCQLARLYPNGAVLTIYGKPAEALPLMGGGEHAEGLCSHVAEVYYSKLADLWGSSLELLDLWIKRRTPGTPETNPPEATGESTELPLTDKQRHILESLLDLDATGPNKRQTLKAIISRFNRRADPDNYKHEAAELRKSTLINAKAGPDGGYWLTVRGRQIAEQFKAEN
jgi:hypothetical protein